MSPKHIHYQISKKPMSKGEIVLIPFPFTDLSGNKLRPALILHSSRNGEDCIVSFISSVRSRSRDKYNIPFDPDAENGIKNPSIIKINKIATLQKKLILGRLGVVDRITLNKIDAQLTDLFALK